VAIPASSFWDNSPKKDEFDDQTCLGGGDWGDFVDDSGG
jgi:hypothetical protein